MQVYKSPDGRELKFPEGMSREDIRAAMQKKYPMDVQGAINKRSETNNAVAEEDNSPHLIKAVLMGMGEGGQNIGESLTNTKPGKQLVDYIRRKAIPESMRVLPDKVNFQEMFNMKKPGITENVARGAGQYAPLIAAGPMGLLMDILAGGAYGATQSPGSPGMGAAVGGGSNAVFNMISKMMGGNPLMGAVARAALGGSVGYAANGKTGAAEGATAAVALPHFAKKLGFGQKQPGQELLEKVMPEEIIKRALAGNKIGTPLTPGEASGRPDITAAEAGYGRIGDAARERVKIGQERIEKQKNAISDLFQKISPEDKIVSFDIRKSAQDAINKMRTERHEATEPFYHKAHEQMVDSSVINKIEKNDFNIKNAIDAAISDPKYQVEGELLGVPRNSIKTLDYAKRKIDAQIEQALGREKPDRDAARVLASSKNKLLKYLDQISPDYAEARNVYSQMSKPIEEVENSQIGQVANLKDTRLKNLSKNIFDPSQTDINVLKQIKSHVQQQNPEAWDQLVKNEMNRLMTQGKNRGVNGRSFFDSVLSNDNRFKQFQVALEHNPQALEQLNNMKTAWEHLINMETPRTAAGQAKTSMSKARESVQAIVDMYNEMVGSDRHIKALKYLYSPKWQEDVVKVNAIKNKTDKAKMMAILLGKTIAPVYLLHDKEEEK